MSCEWQESVNLVIRKTVVIGNHECLFTVKLGEEFCSEKEMGRTRLKLLRDRSLFMEGGEGKNKGGGHMYK